eukprot:419222-Rhodomonas_salina.2
MRGSVLTSSVWYSAREGTLYSLTVLAPEDQWEAKKERCAQYSYTLNSDTRNCIPGTNCTQNAGSRI